MILTIILLLEVSVFLVVVEVVVAEVEDELGVEVVHVLELAVLDNIVG